MRRPARARSLTIVCALLVTLLSGCAAPWPFPQPTADPKLPDAQQIFRPLEIGPNAGDLATLDPALINFGVDYDKAQLLFPGLVTLDEHQRVIDWAAERHEVSGDGLTYTFHLRRGMAWSDGTPIEASTFAYSINRSLDPCTGADYASYLYLIQGAEAFNTSACSLGALNSATTLIGTSLLVPDPLTVQIKLVHPAGYFLSVFTYPTSWAVPQWLVERYTQPATDTNNAHPVVTSTWTEHLADNGAFGGNLYRLVRWDQSSHLEFERNERFWGKRPLLQRIKYSLYKDNVAAWSAFASGAGDVVTTPPAANLNAARNLPGTTYHATPQLSFTFLRPNWRLAPFDDLRIREAFSLAIDRQRIAQEAYHNAVIPSIHLVPEGMTGYNDSLIDGVGRTGKDALTPDLATARALASAYAAEKCGGDFAACTPIALCFAGRESLARAVGIVIEEWASAFPGWRIYTTDACYRLQIFSPKTWQLTIGSWGAEYPDPQDFLSLLWSTQGELNRSYVNVAAADALCAQGDALGDQVARTRLYQQAEQLLVQQAAAIPLVQNTALYVVRSHVVNWRIASIGVTPLSVWQTTYIKR